MANTAIVLAIIAGFCGHVSAQNRCCLADKYEMRGGATEVMGDKFYAVAMPRLSLDFEKNMMSVQELVMDGKTVNNLTAILDFSKDIMYVIFPEAKKCQKQPMPFSYHEKCIPADAKFTEKITLGYGEEKVTADSWMLNRESDLHGASLFDYLIVGKGCIPISESLIVTTKDMTTRSYILFHDYSPGIKDPSVFNIPDFCPRDHSAVDANSLTPTVKHMMTKYRK